MASSVVSSSKINSPLPAWALCALFLTTAYGLLGLTFGAPISHASIMERCVLVDPNMARLWSVGHLEIGIAYFGVFLGMIWYFVHIYKQSRIHLIDLGIACLYLAGSFLLNWICIRTFHPLLALLIGDAIIMTFTIVVSRQVWFQRLLGTFVPLVFLTCALGHFLEGLSYWHLTFPFNVPWTMVTADIGFAILVNTARFPAFIRGQDVVEELGRTNARASEMELQIAALRQSEETRRISEERLDEAQSIGHLGDWTFEISTQKITWSRELFRLAGLDPAQGEPDYAANLALYVPEDGARLDACVQRAIREGIGYEIDLQQAVPQGETPRWYHAVSKPIRDDRGNIIRLVGTLLDITERKQAEEALKEAHDTLEARVQERTEALRKSEERFRATFEQAAAGMAHISINGAWLNVNSKLCSILGYSQEELSSLTFQDLTYPDDLDIDLNYIAQMLAGSITTYSMEKRYIRKDGSLIWINLTVALIRDTDGIPQYFIKVVEDISARKKAQEALSDSETRYRFLAAAMPQIVWTAKPDGKIDYYNQFWFDYTGLTLTESMDWGWGIALHPDDLQSTIDRWNHSVTKGEPYETEFRLKRASDGVYRWHLGRAQPRRDEAGAIIQWVGSCTDMDDYKQTQATLLRINNEAEVLVRERTAELVRSNADLQQFANVASHDLQEPLRMVASFMQLLEKKYKGQLDEQADRWIEHAVDGAVRMQTLINDLLTYSRVGTHGSAFRACDLQAALDTALKNLSLAVTESNAEVTCDTLPTLPGDELQLVSLFQNLLGNALKYRGEQTPHIHISARQEGQVWLFCVRDNGIGIAPQFAERIFIIFQRLHNRAKYPGTGIGLALCKRIIERHHGRIWVESETGKGSAFFFTLPMQQQDTNNAGTELE